MYADAGDSDAGIWYSDDKIDSSREGSSSKRMYYVRKENSKVF